MTQPRPDDPAIPGLAFRAGTAADWHAMAELANRARRADGVDEVRTAENLAAELGGQAAFHMERDALLAEVDGALAGYAIGFRVARGGALGGESVGAVAPELRRHGLGTALFRRTRNRLAAEMAADPRPGPRELRVFALDAETGARALLAAEGFVSIRFGFEMRRFITGALPEHQLPEGLELRPVTPDAHRAVFDADNEAFEDHWGHRAPTESDFQARFHGPEVDTRLWCVAWDGEEVAGVVMNAIYAGENAELGISRGWLEHVSVRRRWRGRGVAKALCAASFRVLRDHGIAEAWLGVDGSNPTGAVRLYEGLGFHVVRGWQAYGRPLENPAPPGWRSAGDRETMDA